MRTTKPPFDPNALRGLFGPAWRQHVARRLPAKVSAKAAPGQDPAATEFGKFLTLSAATETGVVAAQATFPQIAAAIELNGDPSLSEKFKCMVLAEIPQAEIAERLLLSLGVVETWESLFFDVRPARKARDWVWLHVIEPALKAGNVSGAARLQLAFIGNPAVGRCLLDAECDLPLDAAERLLGTKLRMEMKLREAYEVPVLDSKHALAIMNLACDTRRIDLDEKKLAQRALAASRKHELDVRRLEFAERKLAHEVSERREIQSRREAQRGKSEVSPLQRQANADLAHVKKGLAQFALEHRIAHAPLAQLTWGQSPVRPAQVASPAVACIAEAVLSSGTFQTTNSTADKTAPDESFWDAADLEVVGAAGACAAELSLQEV